MKAFAYEFDLRPLIKFPKSITCIRLKTYYCSLAYLLTLDMHVVCRRESEAKKADKVGPSKRPTQGESVSREQMADLADLVRGKVCNCNCDMVCVVRFWKNKIAYYASIWGLVY